MAVKGHADVEERYRPTLDEGVPSAAGVTELLGHFIEGAMGLRLLVPIGEIDPIRARLVAHPVPAACEVSVWAAWATERGTLCACGAYDWRQSQRIQAHVLIIEWWLPAATHHVGWWHCDPRRPLEWTKGRGWA
jgi:hypothetical protein